MIRKAFDNRPGETRYRKAMGAEWLSVPEICKKTGSDQSVVNTVIRRYESQGLVERRVGKKKGLSGRPMIEWRWK